MQIITENNENNEWEKILLDFIPKCWKVSFLQLRFPKNKLIRDCKYTHILNSLELMFRKLIKIDMITTEL